LSNIKIKNWLIILLLLLLILVFRFGIITKSYFLFFKYAGIFFSDISIALNILDFNFADLIISSFLIIIIPLIILFLRTKNNLISAGLNRTVNFTSLTIIILLIFFIFAPLITNYNPNFQKDLGVTKLLPPLSSVNILTLKKERPITKNKLASFLLLKDETVKNSFDQNLIFADSVKLAEPVVFYQNGRVKKISQSRLQLADNLPLIKTKYFLLGTDEFGRDIFSRLVYGTRISLLIGFGAVFIALIVGMSLGFFAGYPGGIIDTILNRFTEVFLAFPIIFLIILILALFGNSFFSVMIVLGFSGWMSLFKIVRGEIIALKKKDFFISAQMIGLSRFNLMTKEILPVILAPVIANLVLLYGNVILAESALSYLGLGVGNNFPSWGAMIESGQAYMDKAWWMIFFPGLALFLTLFTANKIGKEINIHYNPAVQS
jgi:peptide/nickel transport system permease protein